MKRVLDCENMCQRPEGRICTVNCKIAEETSLDSKDILLWKAMEALAQLRPAREVRHEIEAHFGVGENND